MVLSKCKKNCRTSSQEAVFYWESGIPDVLQHVSPELRWLLTCSWYLRVWWLHQGPWYGVKSEVRLLHLTVTKFPSLEDTSKHTLVSDISKTFDVLGWFSPTIVTMKILLQCLWELKIDWDDPVPEQIYVWARWRSELKLLSDKHISCCYFLRMQHHFNTTSWLFRYLMLVWCTYAWWIQMETSISPSRCLKLRLLLWNRSQFLGGAHLFAQMLRSILPTFRCLDKQYNCAKLAHWQSLLLQDIQFLTMWNSMLQNTGVV